MSDDQRSSAIRVDFQNADTAGRVRLNTAATHSDLTQQGIELWRGLQLLLVDGELSATGQVVWSDDEQLWVAEVGWDKVIPPLG